MKNSKQANRPVGVDIFLLMMSSFLFFATSNLLLVAYPLYIKKLGGDERVVGVLGGLFALGAVFLRPYFSRLADRKGRKLVLLISTFTAATGPLLYIPNLGFTYMAFARVYHSISLAAFITASQTILASLSTPENRGTMFGLYGVASGVAMAFAPALGQRLSDSMGHTQLFLVTSVVGLGAMIVGALLNEPPAELSDGGGKTVSLSELIHNRWVVIPSVVLFSITMAQGGISSFLSLHALSVGLVNSGLFLSAFSVASMAGRLVSGPLSDRLGRKTVAVPAVLSVALGLVLLTRMNGYVTMIAAGALIGIGFATAHTVMLAMVVDRTTERERSQAVSFYANAFDLGSATGSMGLGPVAKHSYSALWGVMAAFAFVGCGLMSFVLPGDGLGRTGEPNSSEFRTKRGGAVESSSKC